MGEYYKEIVNNSKDINLYISEKTKEIIALQLYINKMSKSETTKLDVLYEKYNSYNDIKNTKDIEVFDILLKKHIDNYNSIIYLKNFLKHLSAFEYDKAYLFSLIKNKFRSTISSENRKTRICEDIYWEVYLYVLNYNYFELGTTLEEADLEARTAAAWAYVGCVRGKE